MKRVLGKLAIQHTEISGGFSCRYQPNLPPNKLPICQKGPHKVKRGDHCAESSDNDDEYHANTLRVNVSEGSIPEREALPSNTQELKFEMLIVKVPMITLHGIHFKRLCGRPWGFNIMADEILRDLRVR